jgi:hypothetical protein
VANVPSALSICRRTGWLLRGFVDGHQISVVNEYGSPAPTWDRLASAIRSMTPYYSPSPIGLAH